MCKTRLQFHPEIDSYETVVHFIGGNDLFCNNAPSTKSAEDLTHELTDLANVLLTKVESVFVLGIPLRHSLPQRSKTVNALLASRKEGWRFSGISRQIYSDKYLKKDNVHISSNALSGIGYILKSKVFYKRFCRILLSAKGTCKSLSGTKY